MNGHLAGRVGLVLAVILLSCVPAVRGDVILPFTDNFNHETPADDASELTYWSYESAYGGAPAADATIVALGGGDNVLNMNPGGSNSLGIRSQRGVFLAAPGASVSVEADMQLTSDGAGAGVVGFSQNAAALNGYVLAVSRDGAGGSWVDLRKFAGNLNDSFTVGPVQLGWLNPTLRHTYRLEAAFGAGTIDFSVCVDDQHLTSANLNVTDTSPHDFSDGLRGVLASNYGQQTYFDDITIIPEPASVLLLAAGGLILSRRRR